VDVSRRGQHNDLRRIKAAVRMPELTLQSAISLGIYPMMLGQLLKLTMA
jgi:hypothetical protein